MRKRLCRTAEKGGLRPFSRSHIRAISRELAGDDDFVFFESSRIDEESRRSLLFTQPLRYHVCRAGDDGPAFLDILEGERHLGFYVAGWFSYEFGYLLEPSLRLLLPAEKEIDCNPLAIFGVFDDPLIFFHDRSLEPVPGSADSEDDALLWSITGIQPSLQRFEYLRAVERIREYIRDGDTYQVNYTLKLLFSFRGRMDALYRVLRGNQRVPFGAWIRNGGRDILSFSPELFFRAGNEGVRVRPMKGTMARGKTLEEDIRQRDLLRLDEKNRAENVMIVDLLRNDLGRLLHRKGGSVRTETLFSVETYETVLQMTSTIDAIHPREARPGLRQLLEALFPCGSVTGAPKIRTMEIIREMERQPRGVYCGAIGFAGPDEAVFNVPIRTLVIEDGQGEMGIGSGIVHDSQPEREWEECMLKARFLTRPSPRFQLIETLLWLPGEGYRLLDEHCRRLHDSAAYFLFAGNGADLARRELLRYAGSFSDQAMRVRLLLDEDGGVSIDGQPCPAFSWPALFPEERGERPRVAFSGSRIDPQDIFFYHKTTCRDLYDREHREAAAQGLFDRLYCNTEGELTESCIANVFIRQGERLLTPPVRCGLLGGTLRTYLLRRYPDRVVEAVLHREEVERAEALYLGNSVRGLLRVELVKSGA